MNEFENREELPVDNQSAQAEENPSSKNDSTPLETDLETTPAQKTKFTRKKLIICGAALVAVVAIAFAFLHKSKFERVHDEVVQIAGMARGGNGYFTIDTYPDIYDGMDPMLVAMVAADDEKNALEAIKYANTELGFSDSLYTKMMETNALMGRQSEENEKYKVYWTYHPDDGLEVTYEKK